MTLAAPVLAPDDLATIVADVWAAFLRAEGAEAVVAAEAPVVLDHEAGDVLAASVGVTGAWTGRITLALPVEVASLATRTMLRTDAVDEAAVADAAGELANMVGGNVKSLVPAPSTLGLPEVTRGPVAVGAGEAVECVVDLAWQGHPVRVEVWRS